MARKTDNLVLLKSRAKFPDRRVFLGRARLLPDRLLFTGLGWSRTIMMDDIHGVGWSGGVVTVELQDGEIIDFEVKAPGSWKFAIQNQCGMNGSL
ncbi:MAG: hypothetical protein RIE53_01020 [Rhodothermales bacterium]